MNSGLTSSGTKWSDEKGEEGEEEGGRGGKVGDLDRVVQLVGQQHQEHQQRNHQEAVTWARHVSFNFISGKFSPQSLEGRCVLLLLPAIFWIFEFIVFGPRFLPQHFSAPAI